jgi:serine/threonine protein kinase/Tfp pilus assembly protein PilF
MIGTTVLHYRILEKLGEGGMGVVYKAVDTKLRREVAIKFLPPHMAASDEEKKRFEIEAQSAASLSHPNIATVYAIEEADEQIFIVMEFIEGKELKEVIRSGLPDIKEVKSYALHIAEGLSAAHKKGIVHRDIKSANIMVTSQGQIKIMDFGLAKLRGGVQVTRIGTTIGTAAYISPEQARGDEVDQRTDIWSFGVVLYEMLTGKLPFPGDYEQAVIYSILNEESKVATTIDPGLRDIIIKALTKDINKRYQSAEDIIRDLLTLQGVPSVKSKMSLKTVNLRWWIAGAILIAAVIILTYFLIHPEQHQDVTKTIAVLPFTDLSQEKDQKYLSDGLTEELMNVLAQNPRLRVTARNSAFSFVGTKTPINTIADKLKVKYILEGSVITSGDHVRITAELVDVDTDVYKWSNTYDAQLRDILTLQDSISRSVAEALNVALLGESLLKPKAETNPKAYNYYLQGRYFSRQLTKQSLETAVGFYEQALTIDPDYARVWAALSATHSNQAGFGFIPMKEGYDKARTEAEKALKLDPNLAYAYSALAWIKQYYDWDWAGADSVYKKAMKLAPQNSAIIENVAQLSATLGQFKEALNLDKKAVQLDPVSPSACFLLGFHAYYSARYDEAISLFRKELKLKPDVSRAHTYLGLVYLVKGNLDSSLAMIRKETDPFWRNYGLALINYALNKKNDSESELAEIIKEDQNDSAFQIAEIYCFQGETDKAFEWLERAYKQRDSGLAELKGDPLLSKLENDLRYHDLLNKMKLPL